MPKKKVAKVKRAKTGKGKKDGKQESKADKESDIERAKANAALWELRLQVTDQSLVQYRESCRKLARVNEELTNQLYRAEKDTIDVTGFLKRQATAKEEKKTLKGQEVEDYTLQINEMKELFRKKSSDFNTIQDGMRKIEEFQKRKARMEQELNDARLEKEAARKIALVVDRAHNEAIVQLDDASRSVFKENVRLNEALKYHVKEAEDLQKLSNSLAKQNASLALDKVCLNHRTANSNITIRQLSKLRAKVVSLEQALEQKTAEPEREEKKEKEKILVRTQASQVELEKLQKVLTMRERELGHIKRLASTVVEQRTELEQFFHESLAQVKQEVMASRLQYKKEALQAYRWRLKEATAGKLKFPPIRTFHESPHSTNSVYSDMEAAATKVEISDLTWEQREQVLRLLFAKMNGQKEREELCPATFITQAPESVLPSNPNSLPDIHTT
uniref:Basal body orientation factor 1a n=1 Tax=Seriola lalandi dorsalis TaxID=1841481 RepID=A0A3B4Y8W8_SERLL